MEYYYIFTKALKGKGEVLITAENISKVIKLIKIIKESLRI